MLPFKAGEIYGQLTYFGNFAALLHVFHPATVEALGQANIEECIKQLEKLSQTCQDVGFSATAAMATRLITAIKEQASSLTCSIAAEKLFALQARFKDTCEEQAFFFVPSLRRHYYERDDLFGPDLGKAFGTEAVTDAEEAGKCFAFGRWTACVFHLMRVLEHGLHRIAKNIITPWPGKSPLEFQQWQVIIEQIETHIESLQSLPKGPYKAEVLGAYSRAATTFRYFKDAWRNHVSHSRVSYTGEQAKRIFDNVAAFMQDAATLPVLPTLP